jgi:hypothetical protein
VTKRQAWKLWRQVTRLERLFDRPVRQSTWLVAIRRIHPLAFGYLKRSGVRWEVNDAGGSGYVSASGKLMWVQPARE